MGSEGESDIEDDMVPFIVLENTEVRVLLKYLNKETIRLRWL